MLTVFDYNKTQLIVRPHSSFQLPMVMWRCATHIPFQEELIAQLVNSVWLQSLPQWQNSLTQRHAFLR